ncbi:MAG: hypothetical protein WCD79_02940 [Chthoniobacteraceae bacterium]
MKKSSRSLIAGAAMAGLFTGSFAIQATAAQVAGANAGNTIHQMADKNACSGKDGCSGKSSCKGKHDCTGKNACKGQGGCKAGDNGCSGKNSCKGKGGCNTKKPM